MTGKIFLTSGALRLTDGVTIVGPGADKLAVSGNRLNSCCQVSQVFIINAGVTAAISGLSITEGIGDQGGGIFNAGTLSLTHCTVSNHRAHFNGGALYNSGGTVTIISCTLSGNAVAGGQFGDGDGGAIYSEAGAVTITDSTLADNAVPSTGGWGGAVASRSGPVTLTSTTVSGNTALVAGGVFSSHGTLTMTNCLLWGNTAAAFGGGFASLSPVTLTNCTLSGNTSVSDGPGGYSVTDTFVTNSIVWGNSGPAGAQIFNDGGLTVIGHSDVQFSGGSGHWDFSIGADAGGNLDVSPQFVDAAHGDFRSLAGSHVVDAGLTAAVAVPPFPVDAQGRPLDLPGHLRIVGSAVDMGAFELQGLSAPPPTFTLATLIGDVEALGLPRGLERSLLATIQATQQALERGQRTAAQHALRAFLRQVAAQRGKQLSVVHAEALESTASQVLATL